MAPGAIAQRHRVASTFAMSNFNLPAKAGRDMSEEQLAAQLLQHLRVALEIVSQMGDADATYFVKRALAVCLARWKSAEKSEPRR